MQNKYKAKKRTVAVTSANFQPLSFLLSHWGVWPIICIFKAATYRPWLPNQPHGHGPSMVLALHRVYFFFDGGFWILLPVIFIPQNLLKYLFTENVTDIVFFSVYKILSFGFIKEVDFNGKSNTGIASTTECADIAAFTFTTWHLHLLCQEQWPLIYLQFKYFLWV